MESNITPVVGSSPNGFGAVSGTSTAEMKLPNDNAQPKHVKMKLTVPTWGESIAKGVKSVGLVVAAVVCGALALGLLPLTVVGLGLMSGGAGSEMEDGKYAEIPKEKEKHVQKMQKTGSLVKSIGCVMAAPAIGCWLCIAGITSDSRSKEEIAVTSDLTRFMRTANYEWFAGGGEDSIFSELKTKLVEFDDETLKRVYNAVLKESEAPKYIGTGKIKVQLQKVLGERDPEVAQVILNWLREEITNRTNSKK